MAPRCSSRWLAALLRACAVFLIAAQVTAATLREIQDKGLELMLSLPLSRTTTTRPAGRLRACGVALAAALLRGVAPWARRSRRSSGACRWRSRPRWSRRGAVLRDDAASW
jgi:hypothetical protein